MEKERKKEQDGGRQQDRDRQEERTEEDAGTGKQRDRHWLRDTETEDRGKTKQRLGRAREQQEVVGPSPGSQGQPRPQPQSFMGDLQVNPRGLFWERPAQASDPGELRCRVRHSKSNRTRRPSLPFILLSLLSVSLSVSVSVSLHLYVTLSFPHFLSLISVCLSHSSLSLS